MHISKWHNCILKNLPVISGMKEIGALNEVPLNNVNKLLEQFPRTLNCI